MNARQKAKHYKRLYESALYCKEIFLPKITPIYPKHYKAQHRVPKEYAKQAYFEGAGNFLENEEIDILMAQLRYLIKLNMEIKGDENTGDWIYSVDIWLER